MEEKKIPTTVEEILYWKSKKSELNVEKNNQEYTEKCGGEKVTDVLFSFLSIYAIGVWVYNKDNKDLFSVSNKIWVKKVKNKKRNQILCSKDFLKKIQSNAIAGIKVNELNEDLKDYASVYFDVGNLIPLWPGGNTMKGNQNNGFMDVPELFFCKFYEWYQILSKRDDAYLDDMTKYLEDNKSACENLETFLNSVNTKEKYKKYIEHVVTIIKNRTKEIEQSLGI